MPVAADWKKHSNWYWVILVLVALVGIAVLFFANAEFLKEYRDEQKTYAVYPKQRSLAVRVTIGLDGKTRIFEGTANGTMTIGSALGEIEKLAKSQILWEQGTIVRFGDKRNGQAGVWHVYRNGVLLDKPAGEHLSGGDLVEVRYE